MFPALLNSYRNVKPTFIINRNLPCSSFLKRGVRQKIVSRLQYHTPYILVILNSYWVKFCTDHVTTRAV